MTFVIVGGGECAAHAAFALRDRGFTGAITVLGRERLHAYERPPLSKVMLAGHDLDPVHPYTAEQFGEAAIELRTSTEVVRIDTDRHRAVLDDGEQIGFDRALLAVGAQPRRIRLAPDPAVLYLRTHQDALRIREALAPGRRIGIVGAGFIGLELAAGARGRGCEVTVIEATDRALVRVVPASVASDVVSLHERNGVRFHWHATLTRLRREGTRLVAGVTGAPDLTFDTVMVGIGAAPDVRVAEASGLKVENGVVVDDRLCADGDVFAAGDCAS